MYYILGEVVHMEVMTDDMGYQQLVQSWPPTTSASSAQQGDLNVPTNDAPLPSIYHPLFHLENL